MINPSRIVVLSLICVSAVMLAGCNLQQTAPFAIQGTALSGSMYGGAQPISGASIALYAASTNGYGQAYQYSGGLSLLGTNVVTTDSNGAFSIAGDFTCPSASTPVYLVGSGGNPGLPNNATNPQIRLMAALGPCGNLSSSTHIHMNELTTVASVWALAPFISVPYNVGTSSTNQTGLTNAFASVNKLADITTGTASGSALPAGAIAPVAKLNTLANILASCVNSPGGQAYQSGNSCGALLTATIVNGFVPKDTLTAAIYLAQNPTLQTATLTKLSTPTSPFQPSLANAPNDFTLVVTYTGNGLSAPVAAAADAGGNVWIANSGNNSVTELANSGLSISGASGYTVGALNVPSAIAIDSAGNAWIANAGNNSVTEIGPAGNSSAIFTGGGLSAPDAVAIDQAGIIWIANKTSTSVTQINFAGTVSSRTGPGVTSSKSIVINPN